MEMTGERALTVDQATAWAALNDVAVLQRCVFGCESIVATGPDTYDILINVAIGPVKTRLKGQIALAEIDAPRQYTLRFQGQAGAAGFARGEAQVALDPVTGGQTLLRYRVAAQVGGKLAQVGSRLIDAAAATMADRFFSAFSEHFVANGKRALATPPPAKRELWSTLVTFVHRLFQAH